MEKLIKYDDVKIKGFGDYLRTKCQPLEKKQGIWFINNYYINDYKYFQFPSKYYKFSRTLITDIHF